MSVIVPTLYFTMNIIIWNSRGALKPNFQSHIQDLTRIHDPAIFVVMETKLGGRRAKEISDLLPFDGAIHTDTIGYAGGLWLLWNSDKVEIEALAKTEQEIHVEVKVRSSDLAWIFSAIYASPRSEERCVLWENLSKAAELHNKPWIMAGDFNEPLIGEDKFGGRGVSIGRSLLFKDCLDKCSMVDMGFSGPRYTWSNKRDLNNLILERIDRFFGNPNWCLLYPNAKVTHLTRCHSDHCPVLLESNPNRSLHLNRPFRFQSFWLTDLTFPAVVNHAWNGSGKLADSIDRFTKEATVWNKIHFGNIHAKKRRCIARLYGIQRALASQPSDNLIYLENQIHSELEMVLDQERELWASKSRINWMIQGDRNTSFFHVSALARRRRNHIASVKDERGEWITGEREVMDYFRKGFISLYTTSHTEAGRLGLQHHQWQNQLFEEEKCSLDSMVTREEIKDALWSMKAYKAPGPDGLHAGFFQRFWLVVGDSVLEEVMDVFTKRRVPEFMNKTHIVLIPKIQGPEVIGNYRPISLCNTIYKIITKVIVARVRPLLDKLISPYQAAFIPGRRGVDNTIIAQELIHTIGRTKGKRGYMAIKIDLAKAYDKIEWGFIREMLINFNFPNRLSDLILSCVTSVSTSLLFNGGSLEPFKPSRGIRQGDPISPYLLYGVSRPPD